MQKKSCEKSVRYLSIPLFLLNYYNNELIFPDFYPQMRRVHSMYEKSNTSPVPSLAHPDHPHTASNHQTTSHQGFNFRRTIPDHQAEVSLK